MNHARRFKRARQAMKRRVEDGDACLRAWARYVNVGFYPWPLEQWRPRWVNFFEVQRLRAEIMVSRANEAAQQ